MDYKTNDIIKIAGTEYTLGEKVLLDASNLAMGESYIEHTQVNPDRFSIFKKDFDTETIENSWKILNKKEKTMSDYAIEAFHTGSDKFGETPTSTSELYYNTMKLFGGEDAHYVMVVRLVQGDGHPCTSGIGFYKKGNVLRPCSGHMLPWSIEITPAIQAELDNAPHVDF